MDNIQLQFRHVTSFKIQKAQNNSYYIIIRINITIQHQFEAIIEKQFLSNIRHYLLFHEGPSLYANNNSLFQDRNIFIASLS